MAKFGVWSDKKPMNGVQFDIKRPSFAVELISDEAMVCFPLHRKSDVH